IETGNITLLQQTALDKPIIKTIKGAGELTFNYKTSVKTEGTGKGVYLGYGLTNIKADNDKNIKLDITGNEDKTLDVILGGKGGFEFVGKEKTQIINVVKSNTYEGSTDVENVKVVAATKDAFGKTSELRIGKDATVDLNGNAQTVGGLFGNGKLTNNNESKPTHLDINKIGSFDGTLAGNVNLKIYSNAVQEITGTVSHTGYTEVNDYATLKLSGNVANIGNTTVNNGTLNVAEANGGKGVTLHNLRSTGSVQYGNNQLELAGNEITTISGLTGDGTVTKTGTGKTTLVNNTVGTFVQEKGSIELAGTLTGNYEQQTTAEAFTALANTKITGDATFNKAVNLNGTLSIGKNLTLGENVTLNLSPKSDTPMIEVQEVTTIQGKLKIDLATLNWNPGDETTTYTLIASGKGFNTDDAEVEYANNPNNLRMGINLDAPKAEVQAPQPLRTLKAAAPVTTAETTQAETNNSFKNMTLTAFTNFLNITRSTGGNWENNANGWKTDSIDENFYQGDSVTFNTTSTELQTMNVETNGVTVAEMTVKNGQWKFDGGKITGETQSGLGISNLSNNNGDLSLQGEKTSATFTNPLQFNNISVTDKSELVLNGEETVTVKGNFNVDKTAKATIQAVENKVTATGDVTLNGNVTFTGNGTNDPSQSSTIKGVITAQKVTGSFDNPKSQKLLTTTETKIVENNRVDIVYTANTLENKAKELNLAGNIQRISSLLQIVNNDLNSISGKLLQELYGLDLTDTDTTRFEQILVSQIAAPELAADAVQLALWQPSLQVFDRLRKSGSTPNPTNSYRGQNRNYRNNELWFDSYYRSEKVSADKFAGSYKTTRGGILTGIETQLEQPWHAGLFFGYANPRVSNTLGRIDVDDVTFGGYSRVQFGPWVTVNAALAYGNQDYQYQQNNHKTSYGGDSLYGSLEFCRSWTWKQLLLTPIIAADFQKAWTEEFTVANTQQLIAKNSLDQMILRIGLNSKFQPTEHLNLRTRLQYGIQVSGDLYATTRTSFLANPSQTQTLTGVNLGRNMLNVGLGSDLILGNNKRIRLFVDYDFNLGNKSTAHSGQLGIITTF
ncbi:MAG: autotransporter domain-containing protein, partial [Planctomycetaceae bacterium]|nr:autotransporter domain-containing protein [Planctomycetaceae bacterium]